MVIVGLCSQMWRLLRKFFYTASTILYFFKHFLVALYMTVYNLFVVAFIVSAALMLWVPLSNSVLLVIWRLNQN